MTENYGLLDYDFLTDLSITYNVIITISLQGIVSSVNT